MKFVYFLVQVSFLTFISGADDENSSFPFLGSGDKIWEVYSFGQPENEYVEIRIPEFKLDLFENETAAFIIEYQERPTEVAKTSLQIQNVPPRKSIYYWFGKNVSPTVRTETVKYVSFMMYKQNPNTPALIPICRCVSRLEPVEFQMITNRQYIPVKKLYKLNGAWHIMIARVPVNFNEFTRTDPLVLSTSTKVFIFVPLQTDPVKYMKALQFGLYLNDIVYYNQKTLVCIDCRLNFDQEKQKHFRSFLNEINPEYVSRDDFLRMLYFFCNVISKSNIPNQKTPYQTMSNKDLSETWQKSLEFEEKRKNTLKVTMFCYNHRTRVTESYYYERGTQLNDIITRTASHSFYVSGDENDDSFIYIRNGSNYEEIRSVLHYGEAQPGNWQNLKIIQGTDLPVDFMILFPDCWERFPNIAYVKEKLNL